MTTKQYTVKRFKFPEDDKKVILEYFTVKYTRKDMITRTYVVDFEPKFYYECPVRYMHEFDMIDATYPAPELAMIPVTMCRDPFRLGKHKLVLCELVYPGDRNKDKEYNTRKKCKVILDQVKDHEPWFGIEQEFCITDKNDIPLDWAHYKPGIDINSEMTIGHHVDFERQLVDLHLRACIYAGLEMYGCVREMISSQWEFQVGPLPGIQIADHVIIARYILLRLAEMHNVKISFRNIDCARATNARQALHLNFSTKTSRTDGGIKFLTYTDLFMMKQLTSGLAVETDQRSDTVTRYLRYFFGEHVSNLYEIIENVSKYPQEALFKYYDVSNGEEMKWFLNGELYMPLYHEFKYTIGDKHQSSIRIPTHVVNEGKGYIEERRPVSGADPYDVCRAFTVAALFGHKGKVLI